VSRGGRYYAQLAFEDEASGQKQVRRVPLVDKDQKPVTTVAQAVAEMARLKTNRADGDLPVLKRTPKFNDYVDTYLKCVKKLKKASTIYKEEHTLEVWKEHLGETRLDKIRPFHINGFDTKRQNEGGVTRGTVSLDLIALRNLLKQAKIDGWIKVLPTADIKLKKTQSPKRPLFSAADLDKLCGVAFQTKQDKEGNPVPLTKNAQQFADFVRLLAYSGAREQEALALRWDDVDTDREQLTIGSDGDTKNSTSRVVDFNPKLKEHLEGMRKRRAPDSQWLFPSPQRGEKDIHAKTFRESLKLVRKQAGMEAPDETTDRKRKRIGIAFHDLRHYFISYAVMSGVDYMTIASWVGHRDGGVLIGKVYGHLADAHKKAQAARLNFGPVVVEQPEVKESSI
jgi:integrase